jgi:tellurite resistance protein TerC
LTDARASAISHPGPGPSGNRGVGCDVGTPITVIALPRRCCVVKRGATMEILTGFLMADFLGKAAWIWFMFIGIVIALLVLDLGVLHREQREIGVKESLWLSAGYIGVACIFGAWVWSHLGPQSGKEFFTGFLIEKSLAMDNVFVIALIFSYFAIPRKYQHDVLFWGILGVIVLRAIMIGLGATLVSQFSWIMYLFGAFLLFTGVKMILIADNMPKIGDNPLLKFLKKRLRVTDDLNGGRFWKVQPDPQTGKMVRYATPLFLALVLIEFADLVFAVDSVPAIFAITLDPYIVYKSNIFAILGLRALYFALSAMIHRFAYLKYALSAVLIFIGAKIFYNQIFGKMDPAISLSITFALLAGGVIFSLLKTRNTPRSGNGISGSAAPENAS